MRGRILKRLCKGLAIYAMDTNLQVISEGKYQATNNHPKVSIMLH